MKKATLLSPLEAGVCSLLAPVPTVPPGAPHAVRAPEAFAMLLTQVSEASD